MPEIGETLHCEQEWSNHEDPYAVSVMKDDTIIGHVPCEKLCVVWYFIEQNGIVNCQIFASFGLLFYVKESVQLKHLS